MESKKFNIFAIIMVVIMCAVSIFIGVRKNDNGENFQNDILTIYKKLDSIDEKVDNSQGRSAYQIAVDGGFEGTEGEWLLSLKGQDGVNAPVQVSLMDIYNSYLDATNQTSADMDYDEFLIYYYSVVDKYDTKTATQLAYSTTVDICYSYSSLTYAIRVNGDGTFTPLDSGSKKGGASAGAGVIYQMLDTDSNSELDTAYIITNYHVAYIENYSNDPNYVVYAECVQGFTGYSVNGYFLAEDYKKTDDGINKLSEENGISKHFLIGADDQYYGIYLYGYQEAEYKLNATFVGGSADNDIAVLKIERENISQELASIFFDSGYYNEVTVGDSTDLVGGEQVIAVGNPLIPTEKTEQGFIDALVLSSTTGVVSAISNTTAFESIIDSTKTVNMRLIRVDAAINSGNSGGGLYDLYGKLVGIVNSKMASSSYDNVGYAIPVNVAVGIADQVIKQCEGINPSSTNTRIKRLESQGLGFDVENGSSKSKLITNSNGEKEWQVSYNLLVKNLETDSVGHLAGLQNDDIILEVSFDGNTYGAEQFFNTDYEFRDLLLKVNLTTNKIIFKVSRGGEVQTIEVLFATGNFITIK
jgi:S1-C subfamily serine protease